MHDLLKKTVQFADGLDHPEGIAIHADGSVWAGGEAGQVYKISPDGKTVTEIVPSEPGRYQDLFRNVYEAIAEGKPLIVQPEQARTTIRIIELAFESSREKRTVKYWD